MHLSVTIQRTLTSLAHTHKHAHKHPLPGLNTTMR